MASQDTHSASFGSASSDYFGSDDPEFLQALCDIPLPGDPPPNTHNQEQPVITVRKEIKTDATTTVSQSTSLKRPRTPDAEISQVEGTEPSHHRVLSSVDEDKEHTTYLNDELYGASRFGGFGEYMARKRAKLQIQNTELGSDDNSGPASKIFAGLQIYINGYTTPSVQDLRQLIIKHGGIFHPYLDKKSLVTHIITCSLTPAKIREFKHMKVVKPEWLLESVKAGQLLPWSDFIFYVEERPDASQGRRTAQKSLFEVVPSRTAKLPAQEDSLNTSTRSRDEFTLPASPSTPRATTPATPKSSPTPKALYTTDPATPSQAKRVPGYASRSANPHAVRAMADPAWRAAHTSVAPDFVESFYRNSRLHYLSTWKAELKGLVSEALERAERGIETGKSSSLPRGGDSGAISKVMRENMDGRGWTTSNDALGLSMKGAQLGVPRSPSKKGKEKAIATDDVDEKVIMHVDFDSFFVSAGLVDRPHLRGKPVVVCHSQGNQGGQSSTSEIASASYEARKYGIKGGMSLQQARKLCPAVITIPYEFQRYVHFIQGRPPTYPLFSYKEFSLKFYTILMAHADDLQAVSVDEALIDVTSSIQRIKSEISQSQGHSSSPLDPAKDFAEAIRTQVKEATGCTASIGIAHNIMLARLASRKAKPDGSYHILPEDARDFLAPLDIDDLHGFGHAARQKALEKLGTTNLGELAKKSRAVLCDALGKGTGETLYKAVRGIDDRKLESDKKRKSVSCDINYGIRFQTNHEAEAFMYQLAGEVSRRLKAIDMVGRSITIKIMVRDPSAPVEAPKFLGHGICDAYTKQAQLVTSNGRATNDEKLIGEHAWRLLRAFNFDPKELRGIGIQIQKLEPSSGVAEVEPGQAVLLFKPVAAADKKNAKQDIDKAPHRHPTPSPPPIVVEPASQGQDEVPVEIPPPNAPAGGNDYMDLPSFSQVDRSVFDALPEDIRNELEAEYKRRSITPDPTATKNVAPPAPPVKSAFAVLANAKPKKVLFKDPKKPNVKRITKQLAPRGRSAVSSKKSALFSQQGRAPAKLVSEEELRQLDIDPTVYAMLPPDLQREQLAGARFAKTGKSGASFGGPRKRLRPIRVVPKERSRSPYRPPPPPQAVYPTAPVLKQQGKEKGEKLLFTEKDDLQNSIEAWVNAFLDHPPNQRDVDYFAKFLVQCVDGTRTSDSGIERAVAVVKWWLVLLQRHFGTWEDEPEDDLEVRKRGPYSSEVVGRVWWKAFRDVKAKMDTAARKRFGGTISLK
ncbi:DNA repair protein [Panus rudis PR-1116 ss-1]|nr:DNA repair protein [Panus rudis PR-1116 ss-1]